MSIYEELRNALRREIRERNLSGQNISVRCAALAASEAIGTPEHDDYPILKGKEVIVEASFKGAKGQAFTDDFTNADIPVDDLLTIELNSNKNRAVFVSGLNAVFRFLDLCDKTVHCKDTDPPECAKGVAGAIGTHERVLLVGYQPRFIEALAARYRLRVVDRDPDTIGTQASGVTIEPPEMTADAIDWCDIIFATGSTLVNGTITTFLEQDTPVIFYGITISAAARILHLNTYCLCGR